MKNIAILLTTLFALVGCADLPSASKQSLLNNETTIRPQLLDVAVTSRGSLVPAAQVNPTHYRGLFEDRRAARVGDTLTVLLNETTRASKDGGTVSRRNSANSSNFGLSALNNQTGGANASNGRALTVGLNNSGATTFDSKGGSTASNQFSGTITVTVLEVLPNGNLNVGGEKRLAVGSEEEVIRFGGIVSPVNLQGNTILSSQVADARIEYRGAGVTDEIKNPGWLTRFFVRNSPN
jgi:flagellar L-ring protein precursor FlgH